MVSIPLNDNDIHSVGNEMLEGSKIQSYEKNLILRTSILSDKDWTSLKFDDGALLQFRLNCIVMISIEVVHRQGI